MATKRQYHYLVVFYKVEVDGKTEWNSASYLCSTCETNPSGIPTKGYMINRAKKDAERQGGKYIDGSLYLSSMMKLTKAQYDAMLDEEEIDEMP